MGGFREAQPRPNLVFGSFNPTSAIGRQKIRFPDPCLWLQSFRLDHSVKHKQPFTSSTISSIYFSFWGETQTTLTSSTVFCSFSVWPSQLERCSEQLFRAVPLGVGKCRAPSWQGSINLPGHGASSWSWVCIKIWGCPTYLLVSFEPEKGHRPQKNAICILSHMAFVLASGFCASNGNRVTLVRGVKRSAASCFTLNGFIFLGFSRDRPTRVGSLTQGRPQRRTGP